MLRRKNLEGEQTEIANIAVDNEVIRAAMQSLLKKLDKDPYYTVATCVIARNDNKKLELLENILHAVIHDLDDHHCFMMAQPEVCVFTANAAQ